MVSGPLLLFDYPSYLQWETREIRVPPSPFPFLPPHHVSCWWMFEHPLLIYGFNVLIWSLKHVRGSWGRVGPRSSVKEEKDTRGQEQNEFGKWDESSLRAVAPHQSDISQYPYSVTLHWLSKAESQCFLNEQKNSTTAGSHVPYCLIESPINHSVPALFLLCKHTQLLLIILQAPHDSISAPYPLRDSFNYSAGLKKKRERRKKTPPLPITSTKQETLSGKWTGLFPAGGEDDNINAASALAHIVNGRRAEEGH